MRDSFFGWALVAAALAGCLGGDDTIETTDDTLSLPSIEDLALPFLEQDHDHREHATHNATLGLTTLAFAAARDGAYPDGETYFEVAVKAGHAFMTFGPKAGYVSPNVEAGFIIYDVTDPAKPVEVGRWLGQPLGDIEASDDGNWVFASTQRNGYPYPYTVHPEAVPEGELPRGTYIIDVRNKAEPTLAGFAPLPPNGPHTITYYRYANGREVLLQSTYDIAFTNYPENLGQVPVTQKVVISEIIESATIKLLKPMSVFQIVQPDDGDRQMHFPHDATVHTDVEGARIVMDVAYWDLGLVEVDITNPTRPTELSRFTHKGPSQYVRTHLVRVFPGAIEGKLVAVMEPEISSGADAGQYTFVDVTDPERPVKLGHWALPGDHVVDKPFIFSPHNFDLVCGGQGTAVGGIISYVKECENPTVVLAHFHGGLWTLDASDPAEPRATGFFFPPIDRPNVGQGFPFTGFATAFAVGGKIYAPEAWTGLYVLDPPEAGASG